MTERQENRRLDSEPANGAGMGQPRKKTGLKEMKLSDEQYRLATANSSETLIEYNVSDDSIYHITKRIEETYGVPQRINNASEYLIEHGIICPESVGVFRELFRKVRRGEPYAECTVLSQSVKGETLWAVISLTTIYNEAHEPIRAVGMVKDITQQREAELQFQSAVQYRAAVLRDALFSFEADLTNGRLVSGLRSLMEQLGGFDDAGYEETLIALARTVIFQEDQDLLLGAFSREGLLKRYQAGTKKLEIECRRLLENGEPSWVRCTVYLSDDLQPGVVKGLFFVNDINDTKLLELKLREKAERDFLTGLYNKGATESLIKRAILEGADEICAFLIVDLDDFKGINDRMGHAFGDSVLAETAKLLRGVCRAGDIAGRVGGDEFVIFLRGLTDHGTAERAAADICGRFHTLYSGVLKDDQISGSVGISLYPEQAGSFERLYQKADVALYTAKKNGKDSWCLFGEGTPSSDCGKEDALPPGREGDQTPSRGLVESILAVLYGERDLERVPQTILKLVSGHFGFSRGYLFETDASGNCRLSHEWCAGGVLPLPEALRIIPAEVVPEFQKRFSQSSLYIMDSPDGLPKTELKFPALRDVMATVQYALTGGGRFQGLIGFDYLTAGHVFSPVELSLLRVISQIVDIYLAEKHASTNTEALGAMLQAVADHQTSCTYVVDPETYRLTFVNQSAREEFLSVVPGSLCYEAIRCGKEPCGDCPIDRMLREGTAEDHTELYNEVNGQWNRVDSTLIRLADGKTYGLMNSYDITRYKNQAGNSIAEVNAFTEDAALYNALSRSTEDYIFMCDVRRDLFYFPESMVKEFGLPGSVLENAHEIWSTRIHKEERETFRRETEAVLSGKADSYFQEYRARNVQGDWIWLRCRGHLERNEAGEPALFAGIITNLGKKSKIDPVSGMMNKYAFETLASTYLAERRGGGILLMLGLDNFKNINNLYGWKFGDQVIRCMALRMQELLPEEILLYRLDGDKFGVFLPNAEAELAEQLYEQLSAAFLYQQVCGRHSYHCTVSGGYSVIGEEPVSFYALFKQAEYALEYSKSEGRRRLSSYDSNLMSGRDRTLILIEHLRESVDRGCADFELYFQPQVEVATHAINSAEALLRWKCEEYGYVSPVEFVPILEQTGLIHPVGRWVLHNAAEVCHAWRENHPGFTVNVNLSFAQIQDKTFIPYLKDTIRTLRMDPSALHLEITESCIVAGSHFLVSAFQELRALGFRIEMDDFGTGYSSLEILKNAPADVVKIDRAFVKDITKRDFDATFIRFVVSLCHSVDIKVCLEGVETWEEYRLVEPMEVDLIQGYLFGKPVEREGFEALYLT